MRENQAEAVADFVSDNRKELEMEFTNWNENEDSREAYIQQNEAYWNKFCRNAYSDYVAEIMFKHSDLRS